MPRREDLITTPPTFGDWGRDHRPRNGVTSDRVMATFKQDVHDVPDQASQPTHISFPRREFEKSAPVKVVANQPVLSFAHLPIHRLANPLRWPYQSTIAASGPALVLTFIVKKLMDIVIEF